MAGIVLATTGDDFLGELVVLGFVCGMAVVAVRPKLNSAMMEKIEACRVCIQLLHGDSGIT
jgi:hypothetical protein